MSNNKDLSRIKSHSGNMMRGIIKEIGAQTKGNLYELSSDIRCYAQIFLWGDCNWAFNTKTD